MRWLDGITDLTDVSLSELRYSSEFDPVTDLQYDCEQIFCCTWPQINTFTPEEDRIVVP